MLKRLATSVALAVEGLRHLCAIAPLFILFIALFPLLLALGAIFGRSLIFLPLAPLEALSMSHRRRAERIAGRELGFADSGNAWERLSWAQKRASAARNEASGRWERNPLAKPLPGKELMRINDALGNAILKFDVAGCAKWIAQGADPAVILDGCETTAWSAFSLAWDRRERSDRVAFERGMGIVKALLGAPGAYDEAGEVAGALLIESVHLPASFCRLIIERGANVNRIDKHGYTALLSACERPEHDKQIIGLLLDSGADARARVGPANQAAGGRQHAPEGSTCLMQLLRHVPAHHDPQVEAELNADLAELAGRLIARGADPEALDSAGDTALHCAVHARCPGMIEGLLSHGAHPAPRDRKGKTPLEHWAATRRPKESELTLAAMERLRAAVERHEIEGATGSASAQKESPKRL